MILLKLEKWDRGYTWWPALRFLRGVFETKDYSVPPAFDPAKVYGKPRDEERRLQKVDCQDTHSRKHAIGPGISKKIAHVRLDSLMKK